MPSRIPKGSRAQALAKFEVTPRKHVPPAFGQGCDSSGAMLKKEFFGDPFLDCTGSVQFCIYMFLSVEPFKPLTCTQGSARNMRLKQSWRGFLNTSSIRIVIKSLLLVVCLIVRVA